MPPQRTAPISNQRPSPMQRPAPSKPIKSERTHEENQERAYIAASRRSDRSLEARVESARRASEIHKRRTGRGLRVTEQDVMNEEMYEEEEDDYTMLNRANHYNMMNIGMGMPMGAPNFPHNFQDRLRAYYQSQTAMMLWARDELEKRGVQPQSHVGYRSNTFAPQDVANTMMPMSYGYYPQYQQAAFMSPIFAGMSPQMMPQVSYVPNPAQSQGRNMSVHNPQNGITAQTSPMAPTTAIHPTASPSVPAQQSQPIVIPSRSPSASASIQRPSPPANSINSYPSPASAASAATSPVTTTTTEPTPTSTSDLDIFPFRSDLAPESQRLLDGHMQQDSNEFTDFLSFNTGEFLDKTHSSLMFNMTEGHTIIKGEQFPLTPSTATPNWQTKLEVALSDAPSANPLLTATSPQDSPFNDASVLPATSPADDGFMFNNDNSFYDENILHQGWEWSVGET